MLRYFVLATVIVLAVGMVVAAWAERAVIRIKIASVYASAAPKPAPLETVGNAPERGLSGDAPWALSALPECLVQTSKATGSLDYVRHYLPAGAVRVAAPAQLHYGDCTILLNGDQAYVRRGADRFRIPPRVSFYRSSGALALLRENPAGNELRVYESAQR